jgi:hypothetical protein
MKVLAKELAGLNSLDFDRRTDKLCAWQVFLGDALWSIDVGGSDGMICGPLCFQGQPVKVNPEAGAITVYQQRVQDPGRRQPRRQGQSVGRGHRDPRVERGRSGRRAQDGDEAAPGFARQACDRAAFRMHATDSHLEYPFAVGVPTRQFALASWFTGRIRPQR